MIRLESLEFELLDVMLGSIVIIMLLFTLREPKKERGGGLLRSNKCSSPFYISTSSSQRISFKLNTGPSVHTCFSPTFVFIVHP